MSKKKILVLNAGSSSLKFKIFQINYLSLICEGDISGIGQVNAQCTLTFKNEKIQHEATVSNTKEALVRINEMLMDPSHQILDDIDEIAAVGHRVVHGGSMFSKPTVISKEVIKAIQELSFLAPLHNPANITGIEMAIATYPKATQVAVFDTAFHQTMLPKAFRYAIPKELYQKHHVRAYGFHGTSHAYVSQKIIALGKKDGFTTCKMITLHLGNGASAAAIENGKCQDTSMGLSPLSGLVMGTRSGDIDPSIFNYLKEVSQLSIEEIGNLLNKKSGLLGVAGDMDMRQILARKKKGDQEAALALDLFVYRIKKYIGAYVASLDGLDVLIFTAGIGENSPEIRQLVCEQMAFFGIKIDTALNRSINGITKISTVDSLVKIYVVPTNEELAIATYTKSLL